MAVDGPALMTAPRAGVLHATSFRSRHAVLSVVLDGDTVIASGYQPLESLLARLSDAAPDLHVRTSGHRSAAFGSVTSASTAYDDGDLDAFLRLPVRQPGGAFRQAAWAAMRRIRGGRVLSYAQLAAKAGSPAAVRAAGTACATNLVAPFVPCHRVVRSGGAIGQYGYGPELKAALLRHEGVT